MNAFTRLTTVVQILLYLPLTLSVLGQEAFLANSLLLFIHALIHGTLALFSSHSSLLSVLQPPMHPFLLLLSFNVFAGVNAVNPWIHTAASWWGTALRFSSPCAIVMEGLSSLLVAQRLGQMGKELVDEGREEVQLGLLVASASGQFRIPSTHTSSDGGSICSVRGRCRLACTDVPRCREFTTLLHTPWRCYHCICFPYVHWPCGQEDQCDRVRLPCPRSWIQCLVVWV
jgi:hypothetical protein